MAVTFNDPNNWDFVIKVGQEEFRILKAVVAPHSKYFERMFAMDMCEGTENRVELKDHEPKTVEIILRYCYTNTLETLEMPVLVGVYEAAQCYMMRDLLELCKVQAFMGQSIKCVFDWLRVANACKDKHLKKMWMDFIVENNVEVRALPAYKPFAAENPEIVLELVDRLALEVNSLKAANRRQEQASEWRQEDEEEQEEDEEAFEPDLVVLDD
ncbi:Speckle-type POZ protein B-like protein [Aphelenchoides fujianensis]|nr:Speckle-type POZ protein B-like protein [Aphelenchoides fujianensis]